MCPHGLQHTRLPCLSSTPRVYSNSCPSSWRCHPTISFLCCSLLLLPSIFPSIRVFTNESVLRVRWPKYWSFSFNIRPSNENPGLSPSFQFSSVQFSSVAQSCPTLCDPMNRSKPGLPVHHQLPEFTQIHVHRVSDAIQPSHPRSSPSPPAPNPSQHQSSY